MNRIKPCKILMYKGFLIVGLLLALKATGARPDTVYISSGEVLYGEIKSFDRNVLTFDTDYADSDFKIDWDEVIGLSSSTEFTIYTRYGKRITGIFRYDGKNKRLNGVVSENETLIFNLDDITWFITHEKIFWQRIKISIDGGYSYTKSSEAQQFSAMSKINYTSKNWYLGMDFNRIATIIKDSEHAKTTNGTGNFIYSLTKHTFTLVGL